MAWFFGKKEIPLMSTNSRVLGSPQETPEESQNLFQKLCVQEANKMGQESDDHIEYQLVPLRSVLVDGKKYLAGACSMSTTNGRFSMNWKRYDNNKLFFFLISQDGQVQQFKFERNYQERYRRGSDKDDKELESLDRLKTGNMMDGTVLDINHVRKHTKDKKLAELIDKFFLITREERAAYTAGKPYPGTYFSRWLHEYVVEKKDKEGDNCLKSYMDAEGKVHEVVITDKNLFHYKGDKWEFLEAGSAIDTKSDEGIPKQDFRKNYKFCERSVLRKMLRESSSKGEQQHLAEHLKRETTERRNKANKLHKMRRDREEYEQEVKAIGAKRRARRNARRGVEM